MAGFTIPPGGWRGDRGPDAGPQGGRLGGRLGGPLRRPRGWTARRRDSAARFAKATNVPPLARRRSVSSPRS